MDRIQHYFNLIANRVSVDAEIASSSSTHKPDIGSNRERIVEKIEKHSPITMNRRNEEFKGLANTFGIRKYNQGSIRRVK